jgi:hypothetical protein
MSQLIRFEIGDGEIDADDYFVVIEPVFLAVSIYDGPVRYEEDLARFSNPSLDREERQEQVDRLNPQFDDLDNELFKLEVRFDFDAAVLGFIRAHRQKFYFSGFVEQP